jgi:hypothetical protein
MKLNHIGGFVISATLFAGVGLAMAPSRYIACMMPMAMAQSVPSPPEGNPNHEEPAPGANCVHNPEVPDHNCNCHKKCEPNPDGTNSAVVIEDNVRCRSACFKSHCSCRAENCE